MLLTVNEVKRRPGSSQEHIWQESATSLGLTQEQLQEDIWLDAPLEIKLSVRHGGDRLVLEGEIHAPLRMVCGRCLTEFRRLEIFPLEEQFLFARPNQQPDKKVDKKAERKPDRKSEADDADDEDKELEVLEGDTIDGTALVYETLMPLLPMKPLCREDCRGLCPYCGVDLNHDTCSCDEQQVDPRLAALAGWLDKK